MPTRLEFLTRMAFIGAALAFTSGRPRWEMVGDPRPWRETTTIRVEVRENSLQFPVIDLMAKKEPLCASSLNVEPGPPGSTVLEMEVRSSLTAALEVGDPVLLSLSGRYGYIIEMRG